MKWLTSDNKMLGYELMKAYPNISCFSTTRHGGCSKGNYTSFNCNGYCGDEAEDVNRNVTLKKGKTLEEDFEIEILNTGDIVHNMLEYVDIAGEYV